MRKTAKLICLKSKLQQRKAHEVVVKHKMNDLRFQNKMKHHSKRLINGVILFLMTLDMLNFAMNIYFQLFGEEKYKEEEEAETT